MVPRGHELHNSDKILSRGSNYYGRQSALLYLSNLFRPVTGARCVTLFLVQHQQWTTIFQITLTVQFDHRMSSPPCFVSNWLATHYIIVLCVHHWLVPGPTHISMIMCPSGSVCGSHSKYARLGTAWRSHLLNYPVIKY